jgi:hypothetical protein
MKTIKYKDEIKRVTEQQADDLIKRGATFVPKSEWKVIRDANKKKKDKEE